MSDNRMNCWNTLRADENHNVAGNGKRDGLKISRIGQSAAKRLGSFEPFNLESKIFKNGKICRFVSSAAPRDKFLERKADFSLFALSVNVREDQFENTGRWLVSPDDRVGGFTGRYDSLANRSVELGCKKLDGFSFAHRNFHDDAVLKTNRAAIRCETVNHDAALTVNDSCKVSDVNRVHGNLRVRPSNDYPEREYSQAAGRMRPSYHTRWVDEIVFSARKRVAACKGRRRSCVPARKLKAYTNDDYIGIAWPSTLRRLKNDLEGIHQYTAAGIQLIFNGEIGRYENVRYVEQTNIPKGVSTDGLTGTAWTGSGGAGSDWIFFMGEDTVAEAVAVPEEMRAKIPTDYGRSKGVAWYYLGGFGLVQTAATEARVVMWDSAI